MKLLESAENYFHCLLYKNKQNNKKQIAIRGQQQRH